MKNIIYTAIIVPAKNAPDGETPFQIILTEEANGYAIWESSYEKANIAPIQWWHNRDKAIEAAVLLADDHRAARAGIRTDS